MGSLIVFGILTMEGMLFLNFIVKFDYHQDILSSSSVTRFFKYFCLRCVLSLDTETDEKVILAFVAASD